MPVSAGRAMLVGAALLLSACNSSSVTDDLVSVSKTEKSGQIEAVKSYGLETEKPVSTASRNADALASAFAPNGEYRKSIEQIKAEPSARCRRILARAGVAATVLRSPSLTSEISDDRSVNVGIGYDLIDWKRANLTEELAVARCRRQAAIVRISMLLVTSGQALTRSGYLARARSLEGSAGEFNSVLREVKRGLDEGEITYQRSVLLQQYVNQVRSRTAAARAEAARREVVDALYRRDFKHLDAELVNSEKMIHEIQKRLQTANAFKLSASASYGSEIGDGDDGISDDGELTGKVEFAVRLGAFSARRHALDDVVEEARIAELFEEEGGILWRIDELRAANERVLNALHRQRRDTKRALDKAIANTDLGPVDFDSALLGSQLRARVDVQALRADLRALDATIADTKRIEQKLRFQ